MGRPTFRVSPDIARLADGERSLDADGAFEPSMDDQVARNFQIPTDDRVGGHDGGSANLRTRLAPGHECSSPPRHTPHAASRRPRWCPCVLAPAVTASARPGLASFAAAVSAPAGPREAALAATSAPFGDPTRALRQRPPANSPGRELATS